MSEDTTASPDETPTKHPDENDETTPPPDQLPLRHPDWDPDIYARQLQEYGESVIAQAAASQKTVLSEGGIQGYRADSGSTAGEPPDIRHQTDDRPSMDNGLPGERGDNPPDDRDKY